jgi:hypothetical protein
MVGTEATLNPKHNFLSSPGADTLSTKPMFASSSRGYPASFDCRKSICSAVYIVDFPGEFFALIMSGKLTHF